MTEISGADNPLSGRIDLPSSGGSDAGRTPEPLRNVVDAPDIVPRSDEELVRSEVASDEVSIVPPTLEESDELFASMGVDPIEDVDAEQLEPGDGRVNVIGKGVVAVVVDSGAPDPVIDSEPPSDTAEVATRPVEEVVSSNRDRVEPANVQPVTDMPEIVAPPEPIADTKSKVVENKTPETPDKQTPDPAPREVPAAEDERQMDVPKQPETPKKETAPEPSEIEESKPSDVPEAVDKTDTSSDETTPVPSRPELTPEGAIDIIMRQAVEAQGRMASGSYAPGWDGYEQLKEDKEVRALGLTLLYNLADPDSVSPESHEKYRDAFGPDALNLTIPYDIPKPAYPRTPDDPTGLYPVNFQPHQESVKVRVIKGLLSTLAMPAVLPQALARQKITGVKVVEKPTVFKKPVFAVSIETSRGPTIIRISANNAAEAVKKANSVYGRLKRASREV